jgi:hypothetical protein
MERKTRGQKVSPLRATPPEKRRKWKAKKKRGAGALGAEQSLWRPSQRVEEAPAVHPEQELVEAGEVAVKVLRFCANPRLVLCAYQDMRGGHRMLVRVGRNGNFVPGMELKTLRPTRETEVWGYAGALPRFKGRW